MNWNVWLYQALTGHAPLTDEVPAARIHAASSITTSPTYDRFIVIRWLPTVPGPWQGAEVTRAEIWIHDRAQSYLWINDVAEIIRDFVTDLMPSAGDSMAGQPQWEGISQELTDDALNTITRNVSLRFSGRVN